MAIPLASLHPQEAGRPQADALGSVAALAADRAARSQRRPEGGERRSVAARMSAARQKVRPAPFP